MEKLNVNVGAVYTQVMFSDEQGKLHFHRVMTDVEKPWKSIIEILASVKEALSADKPMLWNSLIQSIYILLHYKQVNFAALLGSLRDELSVYLSEDCQLSIQTVQEADGSLNIPEEVEDILQLVQKERIVSRQKVSMADGEIIREQIQDPIQNSWLMPVFYREQPFDVDSYFEDKRIRNEMDSFMIYSEMDDAVEEVRTLLDGYPSLWKVSMDQRGSPILPVTGQYGYQRLDDG